MAVEHAEHGREDAKIKISTTASDKKPH
jgi:hypothetical protein